MSKRPFRYRPAERAALQSVGMTTEQVAELEQISRDMVAAGAWDTRHALAVMRSAHRLVSIRKDMPAARLLKMYRDIAAEHLPRPPGKLN